jgi:YaiO family outer membrane protein
LKRVCRHVGSFLAVFSLATVLHAGQVAKSIESAEPQPEEERFRHWVVVPMYSHAFFDNGRRSWEEGDIQLLYQFNRNLMLGAEIDIMRRPPPGTDAYCSALASYFPAKYLELHGKITVSPDPIFSAKQIYAGGLEYQITPRLGLLLDYQRYKFIQGSIDQIKPGLSIGITDGTSVTLRYARGSAFSGLEYNYYSAALNLGLAGNRRLSPAVAYGTDPNAELGSGGSPLTSLSPAYTYSVFYREPVRRDLTLFIGVQYVDRLTQNGNPLYRQITPTIGSAWKF